jgi:integrase
MRVPEVLQPHFGTTVLKEHLGNCPAKAATLAKKLASRYQDEFQRLRQQKSGLPEMAYGVSQVLILDEDLAERIAATHYFESSARLLSSCETAGDAGWSIIATELEIGLTKAKLARRSRLADGYQAAKAALEQKLSISIKASLVEIKLAISIFNQSQVEWFESALNFIEGELDPERLHPSQETLLPLVELWGHSASDMVPIWVLRKQRSNAPVSDKTLDKLSLIVDGLGGILGRRCIESINQADVISLVSLWAGGSNKYTTIRTKLGFLKMLLRPFLSNEAISCITDGVLPNKPKVNEANRLPFTKPQLEALIPALQVKGEVEFHLFMLMLMTGARREEICQLRAEHLRFEDGYLIASLADHRQAGKSGMDIKNDASARDLPLSIDIIPRLTERVRMCLNGKTMLFPEMVADQYGDLGGMVSKRVNRLIDKVIGTDTRYVLQSTRQTVAAILRRSGCDARLRRCMLGHADGDAHDSHYEPGEIMTSEDFIPLAKVIRDYVSQFFPVW